MAYGIKVTNVDGRVILDSSENRPMLIKTRNGTASVGTTTFASLASSPAITFNDMLFVRRTANGALAEDGSLTGAGRGIYASSGGSLTWLEAKALNASAVSNHTSGYGLNVFDDSGNTAAANLLFTTTAANSLEVVSIGTFEMPGSTYFKDVPIIDGTVPHYVLLTGTFRYLLVLPQTDVTPATNQEVLRGYEYIYSGSTLTKIRLWNASINHLANPTTYFGLDNQVAYVIVKLRS